MIPSNLTRRHFLRGSGACLALPFLETLARADEPFFTTKSDAESPSGMGLGLFLTRAISEQLGGQLHLASEHGTGTTVTLVLPATRRAPAGLAAVAPAAR